MGQANRFQRRQLVDSGDDDDKAAQDRGQPSRSRRDQRSPLKSPIGESRKDAEQAPGDEVSRREQHRRDKGLAAAAFFD